jgi:hypothetical protein
MSKYWQEIVWGHEIMGCMLLLMPLTGAQKEL